MTIWLTTFSDKLFFYKHKTNLKKTLAFVFFCLATVGCSFLKEPEPDLTANMTGNYTQIASEYDPNAKKWLDVTITTNISQKDKKTLKMVFAIDLQYWNPTRKTVETAYSNWTLENVKATDTKNITIEEDANYFVTGSNPVIVNYKGQGSFSGENLSISLNRRIGNDYSTINLKMVKDK
ncbi:hypothetical protein FHS57_005162 [Runella defluvii]|uniref:Uncharacterized protein n=1 Tax=Runella defluvii TaxID=370973 RepID=A0A7W6ET79_9BACT|nr:hypothetical protein [Runella defluvii]MBB3841141.1 hypothetical protein [Runella defluvii]